MTRKISHSLINGRTGAGTAGQGLKVEWDSTEDGELHWLDVDESSLEYATWYGERGMFFGGESGGNVMDYITIATTGNATDFGNLINTIYGQNSCSGGSRIIIAGGNSLSSMDYITVSTPSNAQSFGSLTNVGGRRCSAVADGTYAVFGGVLSNNSRTTKLDYVTISTTGNSVSFGDCVGSGGYRGSLSNGTRGI